MASEQDSKKIVELRNEVSSLNDEMTKLRRKLEDSKLGEKEILREKDAAFSRITQLQSAMALKDMEVEKKEKKVVRIPAIYLFLLN